MFFILLTAGSKEDAENKEWRKERRIKETSQQNGKMSEYVQFLSTWSILYPFVPLVFKKNERSCATYSGRPVAILTWNYLSKFVTSN